MLREIGCWPWDVCAGIVIAQEAGGIVTGSHEAFEATKNTDQFGVVTEEILTGRKYLVVRGIGSTPVSIPPQRVLLFSDSGFRWRVVVRPRNELSKSSTRP